MKKIFIVLLAAFVLAVVNPTKSEAKVMYDGAEVVKGQTGKMTFKKDIKVYKRNPNGTFDSLVVKQNNFFKTYDIEKYEGKTFYHMGQYRVQATDLVVFKEVPIKIRASFYNNPTYVVINRDGNYNYGYYGKYFNETGDTSYVDLNNEQFKYCVSNGVGWLCEKYPGTDLKIFETTVRQIDVRYELTENAEAKHTPLKEAKPEIMFEKGSIFSSDSIEVNGYLLVRFEGEVRYLGWLPVNLLKPVGDK
ncbi:hypothetical protein [Lysinibacillus sp. TE18511]